MNKSPAPLKNSFLTGFTLLELMVVISIILILTAIIFFVLKPNEILSKTRDHQRIINLTSYETNIRLALLEPELSDNIGIPNVIYLSLKDSSANCDSFSSNLPVLPSGWSYKCSSNPKNADGTGWLPLKFSSSSFAKSNDLKLDPLNKPPYYYSYVANGKKFELTAYLENAENRATSSSFSANDSGTNLRLFETGNNKTVIPISFEEQRVGDAISEGVWIVQDSLYNITLTNPSTVYDNNTETGVRFISIYNPTNDKLIRQDFQNSYTINKLRVNVTSNSPVIDVTVEYYDNTIWNILGNITNLGWTEFNTNITATEWRVFYGNSDMDIYFNEMEAYGVPN